MAITGTFLADFSQFERATKDAEKTLKEFEAQSVNVEHAMREMSEAGPTGVQKFNTAATQTTAILGGMLPTIRSVAGAFGVMFSAAEAINFGRELLTTADTLQKLHDRTGLSVQALQQFKVAGDDAGNSVEELAAASASLQDKIAGGDKSALKALKDLGIEVEHFRRLDPAEQMFELSDAIRQVGSSGDQIRILNDLMRQGVIILPTLKRGFDDVRDGAVGMSDQTVAALERMNDRLQRGTVFLQNFFGERLASDIAMFERLAEKLGFTMGGATGEMLDFSAAAKEAGTSLAEMFPKNIFDNFSAAEDWFSRSAANIKKLKDEAATAAEKVKDLIASVSGRSMEMLPMQAKDVDIASVFQPEGAFQQILSEATGAREQAEAQARANEEMQTGLTLIGGMSDAVTVFGDTAVSATDAATRGYQNVTTAAQQAGGAIEALIPKTFDWAQAYRDAGFITSGGGFLGTSLLSQQARQITGNSTVAVNANVNVSGVWDSGARDSIRQVVSEEMARAVTQGRKVAA